MSGRRKASEPVPIRLLAPRRIPMSADEQDRAVAALVAVLVEANARPSCDAAHLTATPPSLEGDPGVDVCWTVPTIAPAPAAT